MRLKAIHMEFLANKPIIQTVLRIYKFEYCFKMVGGSVESVYSSL